MKAEAEDGDYIDEKVSTMALCSLTSQIVSQTKKSVKKQSNGGCSWGMYNTAQSVSV